MCMLFARGMMTITFRPLFAAITVMRHEAVFVFQYSGPHHFLDKIE